MGGDRASAGASLGRMTQDTVWVLHMRIAPWRRDLGAAHGRDLPPARLAVASERSGERREPVWEQPLGLVMEASGVSADRTLDLARRRPRGTAVSPAPRAARVTQPATAASRALRADRAASRVTEGSPPLRADRGAWRATSIAAEIQRPAGVSPRRRRVRLRRVIEVSRAVPARRAGASQPRLARRKTAVSPPRLARSTAAAGRLRRAVASRLRRAVVSPRRAVQEAVERAAASRLRGARVVAVAGPEAAEADPTAAGGNGERCSRC